jgi:hemerythrin-like metal-binding protein
MAFIEFEDTFRVGHPAIDQQHAELFQAVNNLHDAMREGRAKQQLGEVLTFLREYTVQHFQMEEGLMRQSAYPGYLEHQRLHNELAQQVLDLEAKHKAGSMTLSLSVMNFLKDWLAHHISKEDMRLAAHLRGQRN